MPMDIWAIADLHLALGVPEKSMEFFGPLWKNYIKKIESHWRATVQHEDLVLIPGDISWALALQDAQKDLEWIDQLPGIKVLIKGNHDYWWSSLSKVGKILPPSLHLIQNNAFHYRNISIGGTRLWETEEFNFNGSFEKKEGDPKQQMLIYKRELQRLELSLKALQPNADVKIVMTHYPPLGATLNPSRVTRLLDAYGVDICVFGHLHNFNKQQLNFGKSGRVNYYLTSCDYLEFKPLKIYSSAK